nr:hypothetical protein [Agitococcus sp.]MBP8111321.1 hypothetical protein [Agitococcus sp.]
NGIWNKPLACMECRRVCHVNGAAGHCRLVEGIPLLQLGEDVKYWLLMRQPTLKYDNLMTV